MEDVFLSAQIRDRTICVSPVSASNYRLGGGKGLGGDYGYFLYEYETENPSAGVEIIAKAASTDAAFRLFDLLTATTR